MDDGKDFTVLSNANFDRLTPVDRLDYLQRAITALQRLQGQIERTLKDHPKKDQ
jgi:hypothetical protein